MKKIVMGMAALACAASMFAVDVSVTAKLSSSLFDYDVNANTVSALGTLGNPQRYDYAVITGLSVSTDKAGAQIKFWNSDDDASASVLNDGAVSVWFKPIDVLKLSFRENGDGLFGDKYNGYEANQLAKIPGGYGVEFASNGLSVKLNLADGYLSSSSASTTVGNTGLRVAYGADFGSVAAVFNAGSTFSDFTFGAGYSGNFGPVGAVFTAAYNTGAKKLLLVPSAGASFDALSVAFVAPVTVMVDDSAKNTYGLYASVGYNVAGIGIKACYEDKNLVGTFNALAKVEVSGNVGAASWKVTPSYQFNDNKVSVAFETGVTF